MPLPVPGPRGGRAFPSGPPASGWAGRPPTPHRPDLTPGPEGTAVAAFGPGHSALGRKANHRVVVLFP